MLDSNNTGVSCQLWIQGWPWNGLRF